MNMMSERDLVRLLTCDETSVWDGVFAEARAVRARVGRARVLPRGLVEVSNRCARNCFYCGIRRGQTAVRRYRLSEAEVVACIEEARRRGYPAVAFQAGEIEGEENTSFYERLLGHCRGLEVTLSLGEQEESVYRRWRAAGALRYLLRIETSNRELFGRIHPADCSFTRRLACIRTLKRLGYVTGSGVMIGLPGQTPADLARDIRFFGDERLDMVGMGPYIANPGAPLGESDLPPAERFRLALKMIALTRICLEDVNLVAATALDALMPGGCDQGLAAGANVIMPNLTPPASRRDYTLYPGKTQV